MFAFFLLMIAIALGQSPTPAAVDPMVAAEAELIKAEAALILAKAEAIGRLGVLPPELSDTDMRCGKSPNFNQRFARYYSVLQKQEFTKCLEIETDRIHTQAHMLATALGEETFTDRSGTMATGLYPATTAASAANGWQNPYGVFSRIEADTMRARQVFTDPTPVVIAPYVNAASASSPPRPPAAQLPAAIEQALADVQ